MTDTGPICEFCYDPLEPSYNPEDRLTWVCINESCPGVKIHKLESENAKFRKALEMIVSEIDVHEGYIVTPHLTLLSVRGIALEALAKETLND